MNTFVVITIFSVPARCETNSFSPPGSKAMDYSNGLFDCQSPTSPFLGGFRVLHLLEDLRAALELMDNEERDNLRCQIPDSTAEGLAEWLHGRMVRPPPHDKLRSPNSHCIFWHDVISPCERSQRFNFQQHLTLTCFSKLNLWLRALSSRETMWAIVRDVIGLGLFSLWRTDSLPDPPSFFWAVFLKFANNLQSIQFLQTSQMHMHGLSFQTNGHGSEAVNQERLSRLESDKECLILQVCESPPPIVSVRFPSTSWDSARGCHLWKSVTEQIQ